MCIVNLPYHSERDNDNGIILYHNETEFQITITQLPLQGIRIKCYM
jgi:hypothetical protein